jgi:hypothetical protein
MISGALPQSYLEAVRDALARLRVKQYRRHRQHEGSTSPEIEPIAFQPGWTDRECSEIEAACRFTFPPDLRSWLQFAVPIQGDMFPNWRDNPAQQVNDDHAELLSGIWNDIDPRPTPYFALNSAREWELVAPEFRPCLWLRNWGPVPHNRDIAYDILYEQFANAPRQIRIYANRFMPASPIEVANPVFSVIGADIIHFGNDLADYLARQFGVPRPSWAADRPKEVPFWSDFDRLDGAWP